MTEPQDSSHTDLPPEVASLQKAYGPPSQAGFGSAVFHAPLDADTSLEARARACYEHFVGELWQRWGPETWLADWEDVYARPADAVPDVVAELRGITDRSVGSSVPMLLDSSENAEDMREALSSVFDDPGVSEFRVYRLGDGDMVSGLLIAARRTNAGDAVFLLFLMD